ncbi:MAG TPA: C4-dicarboxylate ABC transporter, partial [Burkholderiaceae bacterium]|nr:C4-dicarboxylate ABC transporter [Burkholderiaceae bacterium]
PPFGFALFYLRSVAAKKDYQDRITGETIPAVTTAQIYKGSIAFIVLQLIMVGVVIGFPKLVTGGIDEGVQIDADKAIQEMTLPQRDQPAAPSLEPAQPAPSAPGAGAQADDPMKAIQDAIKKDAEAGKKP